MTVFYLPARENSGRYICQVVFTLVSCLAGRQLSATVPETRYSIKQHYKQFRSTVCKTVAYICIFFCYLKVYV